jgi:transcriptional regulator of heat shock response
MRHVELSAKERKRLEQELVRLRAKYAQLGQVVTKLLSSHTEHAAFAILPSGVHTWGVGNLLAELGGEEAKKAAAFFDRLDEYADKLVAEFAHEQGRVAIGREIPFGHGLDSGMVVAGVRLPSGEEGVVGVLGSKAMRYDRALSVIRHVMKLVSGSLVVITVIS